MPKRTDIKSILIVGAGPIIIGQACEFDYSGAQACKALRQEGFRVILVNSNPATIMTDPEFADATYIEPLHWRALKKVIEKERPDAILPTMGGQTGLNCTLDLARHGVLEEFGVEIIGASKEAIDKAEDREKFRDAMLSIGLKTVRGDLAHSMEGAYAVLEQIGFPTIIRPSFTMGGTGGGIAYNREEFTQICERGLDASPTKELLIEECVLGWKEYEMEVVRDCKDNCIIVCAIENFDPMGVHTGDSITVAPAQTLTDKEYQIMRDASIAVLREIGVDTGGSNVQFGVDPKDGRMVIIEMNPRVSRSSALASKATGFPIAKVAAKLAVGYTLDELKNDITGGASPASFEPSIDYVVTKIPRFDFVKFPQADATLTTQMKSVGEAMAIGRSFQESLQKAMRSMEIGSYGFEPVHIGTGENHLDRKAIATRLRIPGVNRLWYIADAFRYGMKLEEIYQISGIDPWYLAQIAEIVEAEDQLADKNFHSLDHDEIFHLKRMGFSDVRLSTIFSCSEEEFRNYRHQLGIRPVFKRVDSCAAEFATPTGYMYSSYEEECESEPEDKKKIIVLGGGPNRIGQGIEFDYCCVHAALALKEDGYQTIMVNCNPETVSTDYDTSDRLYFEPLTLEDVLEIIHVENPFGVIVQYGGQTPLNLARELQKEGAPIVGTSPQAIHAAEDREQFQAVLNQLKLLQPPNRIATNETDAIRLATEIGYPLVVRPSYVLGGRAMEIVHGEEDLRIYMQAAINVSNESPVLLDRFLSDAIEVDVDAICDGEKVLIGGIMQHIEAAGVHSGDSACSLPPFSLSVEIQNELRSQTRDMALALGVLGLMNVQFAIKQDKIYVLEVNPRASRTVPFVSKATGRQLAKVAARCMVGQSLKSQGAEEEIVPPYYCVKEAVFPFIKFPGVDIILGPEMKSTGEVMGIGRSFGEAFNKAQQAAGSVLPESGSVLFSVNKPDQAAVSEIAQTFFDMGFKIVATPGTAARLSEAGIPVDSVNKVEEGRPHVVDSIKNREYALVINTPSGKQSVTDSYTIRRETLLHSITYFTTMAGASAAAQAIAIGGDLGVERLQTLHREIL
ncbi:MAG: carbamoyl-phosphate synthase large subunit [Parasphingorhabdus sp.]|jgi:carbamoyl-phosphate synthase large subunit